MVKLKSKNMPKVPKVSTNKTTPSKLGKTLKAFVKKREVRRNTEPTMRAFTSKATKIGKSKTTKLKMGVKKKVIRQKTLVRAMRRGSRRNY